MRQYAGISNRCEIELTLRITQSTQGMLLRIIPIASASKPNSIAANLPEKYKIYLYTSVYMLVCFFLSTRNVVFQKIHVITM